MILTCKTCGGVYNNLTPDSMLAGIKPLSKHGECLKCDTVSFMGEYILSIGTENFGVHDVPNVAPECLTLRPEPKADKSEWIVTRYGTPVLEALPSLQFSLF